MELQDFSNQLKQDGFYDVVTVTREPDGFLDTHTHPFEAKALVLRGELRLRVGDVEQVYKEGDVFHLTANEPHAEWYGAQGVDYAVGRRLGF